ncbi:MAG: hypothetical protein ACLVJ6_01180 [Merdibacter sp.]
MRIPGFYDETAKANGSTQTELGAGTKRISKETMEAIRNLNCRASTSSRPVIAIIRPVRSHPIWIGFASYDEDEQRIIGKMDWNMRWKII